MILAVTGGQFAVSYTAHRSCPVEQGSIPTCPAHAEGAAQKAHSGFTKESSGAASSHPTFKHGIVRVVGRSESC